MSKRRFIATIAAVRLLCRRDRRCRTRTAGRETTAAWNRKGRGQRATETAMGSEGRGRRRKDAENRVKEMSRGKGSLTVRDRTRTKARARGKAKARVDLSGRYGREPTRSF